MPKKGGRDPLLWCFFPPICLTKNCCADNLNFGQIVCWMGQLPFCRGVRLLRIENCFDRSSPNKRFDVVVALFAHMVWNSGCKEGFSCSRLKADSSDTTCPTRAMASTLSVSMSLVSTLDFTASKKVPTDSKASTAVTSLACACFSCNSAVTRTDVEVESIFSRLGRESDSFIEF